MPVRFLDHIDSPKELRSLEPQLLSQVANEVREQILEIISKKGGHLASNLGTVELAVALHYVFDTPRDKIVWDVGHQAYPHKILTGRRDRFHTVRQQDGLSGFTCRSESEYDPFGAGHASTSISAALGIAEGMRHGGLPNMSIAVIGDGSLTGGLAFEAMNNAGHIPAKNLLVVFNDNDMSIDPNVGAISKFVNHTVTHPGYNRMRKELHSLLRSLSERGVPLATFASKLRKSVKNFFTPGMLFECFGFRYFGPIDGHNLDELLEKLSFIKNEGGEGGPYLLHIITTKGKGYSLAEELPLKYHGVSPFEIHDGILPGGIKKPAFQDVFADTLIRLAHEDPRVVAITAAMPSGTGLSKFQKQFPQRCYDVGIAEAHAVTFAAGLATEGFRPVAAIYSTFLQRAFDQIIHDVGLQNLPVFFALDRAGVVGADGATHQGAFDLSYLRVVPGFTVMAPKDENELQHMIKTGVNHVAGPIAVRYPRGEVVGVPMDRELRNLPIGKGELIHSDNESPDVLLIGIGYAVQAALAASGLLQTQKLSTAVINARFVKPLDRELLSTWIQKARLVVTVEENVVAGGFGASILEMAHAQNLRNDFILVGMPDSYVEHASPNAQRQLCGLDPQSIVTRVLKHLDSVPPKPLDRPRPSSEINYPPSIVLQ